ncbi:MAG: GGDEF domain-containing protein [Thalassotalea sp.]
MESIYKLTILIVDDNRMMREVINKMLSPLNHHILISDGYESALAYLESDNVDLILMDIEMPEVNGFELTQMIRQKYARWLPIIFLSANNNELSVEKGLNAGGDDYLTKPISQIILYAKIRAMSRIAELQFKLDTLDKKLAKLSSQDPLTKLLNRRALEDKLKTHWLNHKRDNSSISLLVINIDYFKLFNEHYGRAEGDACLKRFSLMLKRQVNRETDTVARYDGEVFVILLPYTDEYGAKQLAEKVLLSLSSEPIKHDFSPTELFVTASIGIASSQGMGSGYKHLLKTADLALYQAKKNGRNCIATHK